MIYRRHKRLFVNFVQGVLVHYVFGNTEVITSDLLDITYFYWKNLRWPFWPTPLCPSLPDTCIDSRWAEDAWEKIPEPVPHKLQDHAEEVV